MNLEYIDMLEQSPTKTFGMGASNANIVDAENQLGIRIPSEYAVFLRKFGWGGIDSWDIYGLGPDVPSHLDLVRITISERTEAYPPVPRNLLPIMNDGAGNHFCLDLTRASLDYCPIVFWDHEATATQHPDDVSLSFADWVTDVLMTTYESEEEAEL